MKYIRYMKLINYTYNHMHLYMYKHINIHMRTHTHMYAFMRTYIIHKRNYIKLRNRGTVKVYIFIGTKLS